MLVAVELWTYWVGHTFFYVVNISFTDTVIKFCSVPTFFPYSVYDLPTYQGINQTVNSVVPGSWTSRFG